MPLEDLAYLPREAPLADGGMWSPPLLCAEAQLLGVSAAPGCLAVRTEACGVFQFPC